MAIVLRIAFGRVPQPQRDAELRRIFGDRLHIELLAGQNDPALIAQRARDLNVDGVILDVAPEGVVEMLRAEVPGTPVLRSIRAEQETRNRFGERSVVEVWAGYGLLNEQEEIEHLEDGALDPRR